MTDLDTELRTIARALVEDAPVPPPMPVPDVAVDRRRRWPTVVVGAGVAAAAGAFAWAVVGSGDAPERADRVVADDGDVGGGPTPTTVAALTCGDDLPVDVVVANAASAVDGPAPGRPPVEAGQHVVHWVTDEGTIEVRWPATPKPVYGDAPDPGPPAVDMDVSMSRSRVVELDVHRRYGPGDPGEMFEADVMVIAIDPVELPSPCDVAELTADTAAGTLRTGLRLTELDGGDLLADLNPLVVEQRAEAGPTEAIPCQGADADGTPPNRHGDRDASVRGAEPVEVLQRYLERQEGAATSGYVEFAEPDGSFTYAVDASGGLGWTTIVHVARDGEAWVLDGWTSSGC